MADESSDQYPRVWDEDPDGRTFLDRFPGRLSLVFRHSGDDILRIMEQALDDIEERPATQCTFTRHEVSYLAYAFLQWTAIDGRKPPPTLMRILHRLLGLEGQNQPPPGVADQLIGLPRTDRWQDYQKAVDIKAAYPEISLNAHAQWVGVDRKTLREWMAARGWDTAVKVRRVWLNQEMLPLRRNEGGGDK